MKGTLLGIAGVVGAGIAYKAYRNAQAVVRVARDPAGAAYDAAADMAGDVYEAVENTFDKTDAALDEAKARGATQGSIALSNLIRWWNS